MDLGVLISAANWLYGHSPAQYITGARRAILVGGEGALADALFELLFTTACRPGVTIDLVRLCAGADDVGAAFLDRNPEALECFASNPTSDEGLRRPLAIHFIDGDADWRGAFGFAWAVLPAGARVEGAPFVAALEDIPLLRAANGEWSAADEAAVPALRAARRVHTAYTLGWNDRYRESDIDRELYGAPGASRPDSYALRSSLRFAVSIPWKLALAGASDAAGLRRSLADGAIDGRPLRDYLAWQEHRSWLAFMTLEGWRMPDEAELAEYLFRGENDHRDRSRRLHPCLCDLREDDWFAPHPRALSGTAHSAWSEAWASAPGEFSRMDRVSLWIHHRCKQIALSEEYRGNMRARFRNLEDALICGRLARTDVHFRRLRLVENLFARLLNNESNSAHPFERAGQLFLRGVREDGAADAVEAAFAAMCRDARVALERNRYRDYREIDAGIVDWLPWIIDDGIVDTVWKLYSEQDYFENIISAMMLRPRALVLVYARGAISREQLEIYRALLRQHGLERVDVSAMPLSSFDPAALDPAAAVVDVSGAGDLQHSVAVAPSVRTVYYERGALHDKAGAPGCAAYYRQRVAITVDEMLQMKGQRVLSADDNNDMLGMEADYASFWDFARRQGGAGNWRAAVKALQAAEAILRHPIWRDSGAGSRFIERPMPEALYRRLIANGGMRTLFDLQQAGAVSGLAIDIEGQKLILSVFPNRSCADGDPFEDSVATVDFLLSGDGDSRLALDDEYAGATAPLNVCDYSRPIRLGGDGENRVASLVRAGYLIARGGREYVYSSTAIRHGLEKEGFALEAYVYYTLFLSGDFDDVRSNFRIQTGVAANGMPLEKEVDVLATCGGAMGLISCKDTAAVDVSHIVELAYLARQYGTIARPILVCAKDADLPAPVCEACDMLRVKLLGIRALTPGAAGRRLLVNGVLDAIR